jgi:hypothetical protein
MRSILLRALPAAVALALLLGGAQAQAQAVALPSPFLGGARTAVNAFGEAVVGWAGPAGVRALTGNRVGGFVPASVLSAAPAAASPQVAIDDHGDALVVWETVRSAPGSGCSTCGSRTLSTGVWAALRRAGGVFGPAIALAGPARDTGADYQVADPRLAMSSSGAAVIAWSDAEGAGAAFRAPGAEIGPPQRVAPAGFVVTSAAIGATGAAIAGDQQGRVITRPAGGAFGAPEPLPESTGNLGGDRVLVAANAGGDAIAAYDGTRGLSISRRPAGGAWGVPAIVSAPRGSGLRGAALSDSGSGAVTYVQSVDPRSGRHNVLFAALLSPAGALTQEAASRDDLDADMAFETGGLDMDGAGDLAIGWERFSLVDILFGRRVAQIGIRRSGGAFSAPVTLTPAAVEHATNDTTDVAIDSAGDLLATWADHHPGQTRINARWFGVDGTTTLAVLDTARAGAALLPATAPRPRGHRAEVNLQVGVKPSRRGLIAVSMSCLSFDGRACKGVLTLTYGKRKLRAGRAKFSFSGTRPKRVYVALNRRTRSSLRRRGRITLIATAVTAKPNGAIGRSSEQVFVAARR